MRRRHHSTNSTHVDPILSMADSSRTESFVNVTWDPTSPEGVTDASDQMRSRRLVIAFFSSTVSILPGYLLLVCLWDDVPYCSPIRCLS